jgi:hypothetical protein
MTYDCTSNVRNAIERPHGPNRRLSPVHTGDTPPTGDTNFPFISRLSPVSPVSPVARARDGFRNNTLRIAIGRNVDARENFSESPGATGDTGDTNAESQVGALLHLRWRGAGGDKGIGGQKLVPGSRPSNRPAALLSPATTARSASAELRALASRVRRVGLNGRLDPEAAFIERDELAHALRRLAGRLERGAFQPMSTVTASATRAPLPRRFAAVLAAQANEIRSMRALLAQVARPGRRRRRAAAAEAQLMLPLIGDRQ